MSGASSHQHTALRTVVRLVFVLCGAVLFLVLAPQAASALDLGGADVAGSA